MSDLLRHLGLALSGCSHAHIKHRLAAFGIETNHFLGARANSGANHRGGQAKARPEDRLVERGPRESRIHVSKIRRAVL